LARADSSVPTASALACSGHSSPLERAVESPAIRRLDDRFPSFPVRTIIAATDTHLLFLTPDANGDLAWVVRVADAEPVAAFGGEPAAVVIVETDDRHVAGILSSAPTMAAVDTFCFHESTGDRRWCARAPRFLSAGSARADGGRAYVAFFSPYASGSSLAAFDRRTGEHLWTADVQQLNVEHSKYHNDVELDLRGESLILAGFESLGCYRQVFDRANGRRLSSQISKR
jgi:outer membrane protein assembly factor BamB